jgi:hypothetical protein
MDARLLHRLLGHEQNVRITRNVDEKNVQCPHVRKTSKSTNTATQHAALTWVNGNADCAAHVQSCREENHDLPLPIDALARSGAHRTMMTGIKPQEGSANTVGSRP